MLIRPIWNYNKILDNISTKQNLTNMSICNFQLYKNVEYFDQTTTKTTETFLGNEIIQTIVAFRFIHNEIGWICSIHEGTKAVRKIRFSRSCSREERCYAGSGDTGV
jgi:hypothetical protein